MRRLRTRAQACPSGWNRRFARHFRDQAAQDFRRLDEGMRMSEIERFERQKHEMIQALGQDTALQQRGRDFMLESSKYRYTYHFTWLGRPVIQFPQDLIAIQEILWQVKPAIVVETGVAHGGSLI